MQNKKYKHKILGYIATQINHKYDIYDGFKYKNLLDAEYIENSSDWEEVKEEQYKVLSLTYRNYIYKLSNHTKNGEICYCIDPLVLDINTTGYIKYPSGLSYLISCKLNSILRIADNETFTIGDNTTFGILTAIELTDKANFSGVKLSFGANVSDLYCPNANDKSKFLVQKAKTPIIVSMDGVDLFDGDTCYAVSTINFTCKEYTLRTDSKLINENFLRFSTKEAADNWIILHKPILSLQDLKNMCIGTWDDKTNRQIHIWVKDITTLIKEKLKL